MNIWQRIRRQKAVSKVRIASPYMLTVYQTFKGVDLYMRGRYDYIKYGKMEKLNAASFEKESGSFKLAVQILQSEGLKGLELLRACACVCMAYQHLLLDVSEAARQHKYKRLHGYAFMHGLFTPSVVTEPYPYDEAQSDDWLNADDNDRKKQFRKMCSWITEISNKSS